jgi:hypothetical protein
MSDNEGGDAPAEGSEQLTIRVKDQVSYSLCVWWQRLHFCGVDTLPMVIDGFSEN